ncbi:MAG: transposase [Candidatus Thiodiazotropha sp. (ex Cardiolucina cf. quadrata)]|nr:transposase [Candidatus Thiodiazotropha sp. (ex Cardiolucina cf. quadrata)]
MLPHLFGYRFAPRYREFRGKFQTGLYGFSHPSACDGYPLKPVRCIRDKLILSEWSIIERILLPLVLMTTT